MLEISIKIATVRTVLNCIVEHGGIRVAIVLTSTAST